MRYDVPSSTLLKEYRPRMQLARSLSGPFVMPVSAGDMARWQAFCGSRELGGAQLFALNRAPLEWAVCQGLAGQDSGARDAAIGDDLER